MNQILSSEFQRIHSNLISNIIHKALCCIADLGNAIASHGSCSRTIGINRICLTSDIRAGILKTACSQAVSCNGMSVGSVSSLIGISNHLFCQKMPLLIYSCCHFVFNRMTGSGIGKGLLTGKLDLYRASANLHGKKSIQRLVKHFLLISKAAAYIWLNDTHLSPWDSQCLTNYTADNVRYLCGRNHNNSSLFHICIRNIILNVTVLNNRGLIASVDLYSSILQSLIHITDSKAGTRKNIILLIKMNGMLTSPHRKPGA